MQWMKVAILSALVIITATYGNPLDNNLHNDVIQENKFLNPARKVNKFKQVEPVSYRLPTDSIPLHYDIVLETNIHNGDFIFSGEVKIQIKIVKTTSTVTLHYRQIDINQVDIFNSQGVILRLNTTFSTIPSHDFLIIDLDTTRPENSEFLLRIKYKGELRGDGQGFYYGSYMDNTGIIRFYGATQFEVDDARHAMPCYDEPGIRATMTLTIKHGQSYSAIANTEIVDQQQSGDYYITKFETTPKMQTYLLAFAVSDYEYVNATNSRIPQKIYATPIAIQNGDADLAAGEVGPVLAKFEQVLNVSYPLTKMDHIALTKFNFGAMENFGLITYIDRGLLLDPRTSESGKLIRKKSIVSLICHEYAHQWFGNIVSPQWWQYTWLNEGFATLFANYIPELMYPDWKSMRLFFTSTMRTAFNSDGIGSWAMNHYTEQPNELWDKFGGIGYQKSGSVIRMFMEVLTPEVFLKGLNIYLKENYMKAATPAELHAGLQKAYDEAFPGKSLNIEQLMKSWEDKPGYPLISVSLSGTDIKFTQRRYPTSNGELYSVPITLATKSNPTPIRTPKLWLYNANTTESQSSIGFNTDDWLLVNIDQVGYYRVSYDLTLWRALIAQLNDNHELISAINRAVLQEEFYMALTEIKIVTGVEALKILTYFDKEKESIAWSRADSTLLYMHNHLFGTPAFDKYRELVQNISHPHLEELGHEGFDGEDPERASLRAYSKFWNCQALDGDCLLPEYQKLDGFLNGTGTSDFNWCHGMRLVGADLFTTHFDRILADQSLSLRKNFLEYAGCSVAEENQQTILKTVLDSANNLNDADREVLLKSLYLNSVEGLDRVLDFIKENYNGLLSVVDIYETMYNIGSVINGEPRLSTFLSIIDQLQNYITEEMRLNVMEKVRVNSQWMNTYYSDIQKYFDLGEWESITDPTTPTPSPSPPVTTTQPTATTPGAANSIIISINLIFVSIFITLVKF